MRFWDWYSRIYDVLLNKNFLPYQRLQENVVSWLSLIPRIKIVDLGCGTGNTLEKISVRAEKMRFPNVGGIGIELSPLMKKISDEKFKNSSDWKIIHGNACDFISGQPEFSFDRVIMVNSLYTFSNPKKILGDAYRTLSDGGILIVANPTNTQMRFGFYEHFKQIFKKPFFESLYLLVKMLAMSFLWVFLIFINKFFIARKAKGKKFFFFSEDELRELILKTGFIIEREDHSFYGNTLSLFRCRKELPGETKSRRAQTPEEVEKTFEIRWKVYCEEIRSLNPDDYPDKKEFDWFDRFSIHFLTLVKGNIVGCMRLIPDTKRGFLMEQIDSATGNKFVFSKKTYFDRSKAIEPSRTAILPEFRKTNLAFQTEEFGAKWSKDHGYDFWCLFIQERLYKSRVEKGWNVIKLGEERNYHDTVSFPVLRYL